MLAQKHSRDLEDIAGLLKHACLPDALASSQPSRSHSEYTYSVPTSTFLRRVKSLFVTLTRSHLHLHSHHLDISASRHLDGALPQAGNSPSPLFSTHLVSPQCPSRPYNRQPYVSSPKDVPSGQPQAGGGIFHFPESRRNLEMLALITPLSSVMPTLHGFAALASSSLAASSPYCGLLRPFGSMTITITSISVAYRGFGVSLPPSS
ncbi:hypothetical protein V8C37DRAFT_365376 [Trichoderma ceciliae]